MPSIPELPPAEPGRWNDDSGSSANLQRALMAALIDNALFPNRLESSSLTSVLHQTSQINMVKALTFKGDKKPKKRKRAEPGEGAAQDDNTERQLKAAKADDAAEAEHDDSWVSADAVTDISGPVMFVLPTEPPTALACDAIGKVFTLPIENIVDGNPSTAEPHDVRQVWIANRIAGTEHFRIKGHHGKCVLL